MKLSARVGIVVLFVVAACGEDKPPVTPAVSSQVPASASAVSVTPPPSAAPSTAPVASPSPAPPKGKFVSFAHAATSGKVDKVGTKDGALKPDGIKDLVFEAEFEGAATAFLIVSTDGTGAPDGSFNADTLVGDQALPDELAANLNQGKFTAGIAIYEGEKLLNAKDGSFAPLVDGRHKLVFHISSKDAPKSAYKAVALFADKSVVMSPFAPLK